MVDIATEKYQQGYLDGLNKAMELIEQAEMGICGDIGIDVIGEELLRMTKLKD